MITQLWLADIRNWPQDPPVAWVDALSMDEQIRLNRMGQKSVTGREYLYGRVLLRFALKQSFPTVAAWVLAAEGPTRVLQPSARQLGAAIHINLSHSRGLVVCALSSLGPCGCDVESTPRPGNQVKIAQRYFTPAEVDYLETLAKDSWDNAFFTLWTMKEAYLKARQEGIPGGLDRLEVLPRGKGWHVSGFEPDERFSVYHYCRQNAYGAIVFSNPHSLKLEPQVFQLEGADGRLRHRMLEFSWGQVLT